MDIELIKKLAMESDSVLDLLKKLNRGLGGSSHTHLSRQLKKHNIDTSHFTRKKNKINASEKRKLSADFYLVEDRYDGRRTKAHHLRRSLLEIDVPYKCNKCGLEDEWQGLKLVLEVDHIDNVNTNNKLENLRFLCPNCHSQRSNALEKTKVIVDKNVCVCGKQIKLSKNIFCSRECFNKEKIKKGRSSEEIIYSFKKYKNFVQTAKFFNISDVALRKNCLRLGILEEVKNYK